MKKDLKRAVAVVVSIALAVTPVVVGNTTANAASATNATVTESKDYTEDPIVLDSTAKDGWAATPSDAYQLTGDFDVTFELNNSSQEAEAFHNYLLQLFNDSNVDYGVLRADCFQFGTNFDDAATPKITTTWTCSYWGGDWVPLFKAAMADADVVLNVKRKGNTITVHSDITTNVADAQNGWTNVEFTIPDSIATNTMVLKLLGEKCIVTINKYTKAPTTLKIEPTITKLSLGGTKATKLNATIENNDGTNTLRWTSSDENVATVDTEGNVTAVAAGTTTITATLGELTATCTVEVVAQDITITSVDAEASFTTLYVGGASAQITSSYEPTDATVDATPTYSSSNESVLTVGADGKVTGVAVGDATVTVTRGGKTATVDFRVKTGTPISGAWWAAFTPGYQIKDNSIVEFDLSVKGGNATWNNFAAIFTNIATTGTNTPNAENYPGYFEYAVVRGDNFGWGGGADNISKSGNPIVYKGGIADTTDAKFIELMKAAFVNIKVQKSGNIITYVYTATGANGESVTRTATVTEDTGIGDTDSLYVFFAPDTATIICDNIHNYALDVTAEGYKAPTCTEAGIGIFKCTDEGCGESIQSAIEMAGHALTKVEAKEATTTAEGNIAYYTCSVCEKCFSDAEGKTEITRESTVVPKKEETQTPTTPQTPAASQSPSTPQSPSSPQSPQSPSTPQSPTVTQAPTATQSPTASQAPTATQSPTTTQEPPTETQVPSVSHAPTVTQEPTASQEPSVSQAPSATQIPQPDTDNDKEDSSKVDKGTTTTDTKSGGSYKVTVAGNSNKATVEYVKPIGKAAKATTVTIPATVKVDGVTCKVTSIKANAFANNKKVKSITVGKNIVTIGKKAFYQCKKVNIIKIKSKKLTKKNIGKNAFKGINAKVKIKVPKSKLKEYKKLFRSKGLSKEVKIVKL